MVRIVLTRYGARLVHGRSYLSKILRRPGPTHEVFDVLAAVVARAPRGPAALLGFAGGGMIAPLRALGDRRPIRAVDLDPSGEVPFRQLCGPWCGSVEVARGDAVEWLRAGRSRAAVVVEDLSVDGPEGATKPGICRTTLPALVRRRLAPDGWLVVNALPVPGVPLHELERIVSAGLPHAVSVRMTEHENRVVVASRAALSARELGRSLRRSLAAIGSSQAGKIRLCTLRGPA